MPNITQGMGMAAGSGAATGAGIGSMIAPGVGTAIGAGAGALAGMGMQLFENKQQLKQNPKLIQQQIAGSEELSKYNQGLAIDTWKKTGVVGQMQQIEKAGLNPGLMYEGVGGGGSTTVTPGNVQGGSASGMHGNQGMALGLSDMALKAAQIKLMNAQADKTEIEAQKTAGVDTQNAIKQGQLMGLDAVQKELQNNITKETSETIINRAKTELDKLTSEALIEKNNGTISEQTYNERIKQAELQTQKMMLDLVAEKALIKLHGSQTQLNQEQIKQTQALVEKYYAEMARMAEQTNQGWAAIDQTNQEIAIKNVLAQFTTSDAAQIRQWTQVLQDVTGSIKDIGTTLRGGGGGK